MSTSSILRERFLHLQETLASRLRGSRTIHHDGEMGSATEAGWRDMLSDYLPKRYCAAKGFVIDSGGNQSQQLDLVLHDRQYSPFLFNQNNTFYIPAESVYAVFEVKQDLDRRTVRAAGEKVASVRRLHRTSAPITWMSGTAPPRKPIPILGGLLCFKSGWNPPLGEPMAEALAELSDLERLDLLCALTHGSCEVAYPEGEAPQIMRSAPDTALIFFFLRLFERLQAVGTVTAMDVQAYSRVLED